MEGNNTINFLIKFCELYIYNTFIHFHYLRQKQQQDAVIVIAFEDGTGYFIHLVIC